MSFQMIWTRGAIEDFWAGRETKRLLAHTISNLEQRAFDTFRDRMRYGTPFITVKDGTASRVCVAPSGRAAPHYEQREFVS